MSFFSNIFGTRKSKNLPNKKIVEAREANFYLSSLVCLIKKDISLSNYNFIYSDDKVKSAREDDGTAPDYLGHFLWISKYMHAGKVDFFTELMAKYDCQLNVSNHIENIWKVRNELFNMNDELPSEIHTSEMVALMYLELLLDSTSIESRIHTYEAYATLICKYNLSMIKTVQKETLALIGLTAPVLNVGKTDTMKFLIDTAIEHYFIDGLKNFENGVESEEHLMTLECLASLMMKGLSETLSSEEKRKAITLTVKDVFDTTKLDETSPVYRLYHGYLKQG